MQRDGATPTTDVPVDPAKGAGAIWVRRAFLSLLALIVLLGLLGFLGVKSRTASTRSADGAVNLEVHYAQVARAGLDVPFEIIVHRRAGFDDDVVISVSRSYLQMFDRNTMDPEPSSSTTTAQDTIWRFDQPPGNTFVVSLDMQVQKGRHWGRSGTVAVLGADGAPTAHVTVKTWLSP
jgi:hypothetical protein